MYHRSLDIFIASRDPELEKLLREVQPLERFSHNIHCLPDFNNATLKLGSIVILDFATLPHDLIWEIKAGKDEKTILIGCFSAESFSVLTDNSTLFDQVWCRPFIRGNIQPSFTKILKQLKEREDAILNEQYLTTLIDSLPDLIWFKDARGAHIKVNNTFCRTVNKTKAQIEGRGHYYIWDLKPDEYAQGEYICLESEEIVLNRKETCLFDETVKCGGELRKFKTYKSPIFDTDGEVIGTTGFAHDVTDLQNLMIELNILIESLPFAVLVTDKDQKITNANQKFFDMFILDRTELIGKTVDSFLNETKTITRSKRWIIEHEGETTLLLSRNKVLKVNKEPLLDIFGVMTGLIYLFLDMTIEHQQKNKLLIDANTDHLTKLNNRRSLQDFMRKTPCRKGTALLLLDLDNFKEVNDQYGHDEGDRVLVAFAGLLQQDFPPENLFRLGGDEFAIILEDMEDTEKPIRHAKQLLAEFNKHITQRFSHTKVSLSIGIAVDIDNHGDFGELFKQADMALYDSKKAGKSACTLWNRNFHAS